MRLAFEAFGTNAGCSVCECLQPDPQSQVTWQTTCTLYQMVAGGVGRCLMTLDLNRMVCIICWVPWLDITRADSDQRSLTSRLTGRGYIKCTANFTKGTAARCHVGGRDRRHCDWEFGKGSSPLSSRHRAAGSASND